MPASRPGRRTKDRGQRRQTLRLAAYQVSGVQGSIPNSQRPNGTATRVDNGDMKTESRLPKTEVPPNGELPISDQKFSLKFSKSDADVLATICDVALKAAGLPAAQSVETWMRKVRDAMTIANKT
jgi:hypothetical protein